jgi:hypothetical protein
MNAFLEILGDKEEIDPLTKNRKNQVREMAYDIEQSFGEGGAEQVGQGGAEQVGEGGAATGDRRPATVRQTTGDSAATAEVCTLSLGLGLGLGLFTFTRATARYNLSLGLRYVHSLDS